MKPRTIVLVVVCMRAASADEPEVLPAPPTDVTALARAEYQQAEQAFAEHDWVAAEKHLNASWDHQHNHITLYDLAAVHMHQNRLIDAGRDMFEYFAFAPPAISDSNNAAARARLARIKHLRGHDGRLGREVGKDVIAEIRAGHYDSTYKLDHALDETQDLSLLYWIVAGEYRMIKARVEARTKIASMPAYSKRMNSWGLNNYRRILGAYFSGATDLSELWDAQRLFDEIDVEARRSTAFEKRCGITLTNPNALCPETRGTKMLVIQ